MKIKNLAALTAAAGLAVLLSAPQAAATVRLVDDDAADCPGAGYTVVQDAVNDSSPNDEVVVCTGSYNPFRVSTPGVTVKGAGNPVIDGSLAITLEGQENAIVVDADGVTIERLTIVGGTSGKYSTGILIYGSPTGVRLIRNTIDMRSTATYDPALLGNWPGGGVTAKAGNDPNNPTVIERNDILFGPQETAGKPYNGIQTFDDDLPSDDPADDPNYVIAKNKVSIVMGSKYQVAINVRGTNTVEKNEVTSPDNNPAAVPWNKVFGIWFAGSPSHGKQGSIEKNRISYMDYAIWISGPNTSGVLVEKNDIDNSGIGIILESGADTISIEKNRVMNSIYSDILDNSAVKEPPVTNITYDKNICSSSNVVGVC